MCLQQRYITNRTLHFDLFKPLRIPVPCGKCEECKKIGRNEWFVRSYYEWIRCGRTNTYFYTLTYNNDNLPLWNGVQHFSKRHIQLFIKRLRKRLSQHDVTLKYLVTCEFGEKRGRCHYHVLFFLSRTINPYWFYKFVEDAWQYGFVKYGNNVGLVNSSSGIEYVTKYVTKDYSQLDVILPKVSPFIYARYKSLYDYVCQRWNLHPSITFRMNKDFSFSRVILSRFSKDDEEFVQKFLTKIRRYVNQVTPFHLQSSRLGSNIAELSSICLDLEQVPLLKQSPSSFCYRLPRYIKRLLWYDVVEGENSGKKDTFVLNEEGKKHQFNKLLRLIDDTRIKYENVFLNASSLSGDFLLPINNTCNTDFRHVRDIVFWLQHCDIDLDVLSIYSAVFRGRVCTFDFENLNGEFIKDNWQDYAYSCIFDTVHFDYGEISKNYSLQKYLSSFMFNNAPYFQPYEFAVQLLNSIINEQSRLVALASLQKEKNTRNLRQLLST